MKANITVQKEVDLKTIFVNAGVRYWEDSSVNGVDDTEDGTLIPCKVGSAWMPVIDIETGKISNWKEGATASIHYKVCDCFSYSIRDASGAVVFEVENDYVPSFMCPKDSGYGDYIIMDIDANGTIQDWRFDASDFEQD